MKDQKKQRCYNIDQRVVLTVSHRQAGVSKCGLSSERPAKIKMWIPEPRLRPTESVSPTAHRLVISYTGE